MFHIAEVLSTFIRSSWLNNSGGGDGGVAVALAATKNVNSAVLMLI